MTNYRMIQNSNSLELQWQYDFTMYSDAMAIEYASKQACAIKCSLELWRLDDQVHVASIKVKTTTVAVVS